MGFVKWLKIVIPVIGKILPVINMVVYLFAGFGVYSLYADLTGKQSDDIVCSQYKTVETTKAILKREQVVDKSIDKQGKVLEVLRTLDQEEIQTQVAIVTSDTENTTTTTKRTVPTVKVTTTQLKASIPRSSRRCTGICLTEAQIQLIRETTYKIQRRLKHA